MLTRLPRPSVRPSAPRATAMTAVLAPLVLLACGGSDLASPPATTGAIHVTASTTGTSLDPDGYVVSVDGGAPHALAANGDLTVESLTPGGHTVALAGLAANCSVAGSSSRTATVTVGETATVAFALTCTTAGSVTVTTTTTGTNPDADGYTVRLDQGTPQAIGNDSTVTLTGIAPGAHFVTLAGLASNCHTPEDNPRAITVTADAVTEATFVVFCPGP
jgi:hypothetical protein